MGKEKCYIAGKIGDLLPEDYEEKFAVGRQEVRNLGFVPVCPTCLPHKHDKSWQSYMKEDLTAMFKCTTVYVLRNWRHSPGAKEEVRIAVLLGLNIIHQK